MNDLFKQSVNIFIVDDEVEIRDSLSRFFTYHGCQVEVFSEAKSYLDQLDQAQLGCLVSDIDMEEMNGEKIKIAIDSNRKQIELLGRYRTLTKKECEIFECVAKGKKNKEMAENLCISMPTVEAHRSRVMKKMQASSLSELVKMSVTLSK